MLNREKMHRLLELMLDARKKRIINPDDPRIMLVLLSDESDMKFILLQRKPPLTSPYISDSSGKTLRYRYVKNKRA